MGTVTAYIGMACILMLCILMACTVMAYIVMACIDMAHVVMACIVMADTVMAVGVVSPRCSIYRVRAIAVHHAPELHIPQPYIVMAYIDGLCGYGL